MSVSEREKDRVAKGTVLEKERAYNWKSNRSDGKYIIARDSRLSHYVLLLLRQASAPVRARRFRKSNLTVANFYPREHGLAFSHRRASFTPRSPCGCHLLSRLEKPFTVSRTYVHMYIQTRSRRAACRCYKVREILGSGVTRFVSELMLARASEFLCSDLVSTGCRGITGCLTTRGNYTDCLKLTRASRAFAWDISCDDTVYISLHISIKLVALFAREKEF